MARVGVPQSDLGEDEDDAEFRNMFSSGPNAVSNANDPGSSEEEDVTREEIRLVRRQRDVGFAVAWR